jgi:hypothetical protein
MCIYCLCESCNRTNAIRVQIHEDELDKAHSSHDSDFKLITKLQSESMNARDRFERPRHRGKDTIKMWYKLDTVMNSGFHNG